MKPLNHHELEQLLDVYGADPSHWPDTARSAAEALIVADVRAAALYGRAQALNARLAELPEPELPQSLTAAILRSAPAPRGVRAWWAGLAQLWTELGGLRLAGPVLACGLMAGITWPLLDPDLSVDESMDLISIAQLGEEQWEITDLETTP